MIESIPENLYLAIKKVKRITPHPLPILNYALIQIDDGLITISTTDLDKPLTATAGCRSNGEKWDTCAPMLVITHDRAGHKHKYYPLVDYLKVLSEYETLMTLSFNPNIQILTIFSGNSTAKFNCLPANEFPPIERIN